MTEFDRSTPVTVSLRVQRGIAEVVAEDRATVRVEISPPEAAERFTVALEGDTLVVHGPEGIGSAWRTPRADVRVRVPADSILAVKSAAADLRLLGRYALAQITGSSADVHLDHVTGDASVKSASGDLTVRHVGGTLRISTSSGEIGVGDVTGDVIADTSSGDLTVQRAGGSLQASTASGDLEIGALSQGQASLKSSSGDITVGVTPGTGVWLDLETSSGKTLSDLTMGTPAPADGPALALKVRTASGDIDIHRALVAVA
ncbi:DUF4097 family beta strand repeat-containing protein [Actinoplanes sp. N902-109]|uniref:DUF4097 family beta strand repeat-containing protein n=1 Tax=Actinoplanes sp. (strain N902-109) TaxID=649831 RepID=UPI00032947D4|nr:DUF4097 family beta strand repeat-containing protein [Actinoplanes sp. N902-109]AGL18593.1 hypothetical protein L083_5083 [Actinoplanes sp. N902-109]